MGDKKCLMATVARMYYEHGISQKNIAAELALSRGYVCQLLDQARSNGIVEIKIRDVLSDDTELERYVRELFGLRKAKIVPMSRHESLRPMSDEITAQACKYLDSVVESGMNIAFSWGRTMFQISSSITRRTDIKNVTIVPFCGGTSNLNKKIYVFEISTNLAAAYNGTPLYLPLPAILQSAQIKKAVYSDNNMRSLLNRSKFADIALFTVGGLGEQNVIYRSGYIGNQTIKRLMNQGAVGDICAHFIDQYGEICDQELDSRTISIDMKDFSAIRHKICIAVGIQKAKALLSVLRKGYVDVLITDEDTIQAALKEI